MQTSLLLLLLCISGVVSANEAQDRLSRLSYSKRNTVFTEILREESCGQVKLNFFQGVSSDGSAFWNVICSNGNRLAIMIENDRLGSTKVLECDILKVVVKVDCFKKF